MRPQVGDLQRRRDLGRGGAQCRGEGVGGVDAVVEDQDAAQVMLGDRAQHGDVHGGHAQAVVVGAGARSTVGEDAVQVLVGDDRHQDLVVGQDAAFDGLGQVQAEDGGAEDVLAVHGGHGRGFHQAREVGGGRGVPDAGGGGHVQAGLGRQRRVVVDGAPALAERTAGAVGLIDDDQVPGGQAVLFVGALDLGGGGVGREDRARARCAQEFGDTAGLGGHHRLAHLQAAVGLGDRTGTDHHPGAAGLAPAGYGLGDQGLSRHQHQHRPLRGQLLGDPLCDQSLAGAAGSGDRHTPFPARCGVEDHGHRLGLVVA